MITLRNLLISTRPKQWIKNGFIFAPLVFGLKLFDFNALLKTSLAFSLFTASAAGVYLINDILDLKNDQQHPLKKFRPIASGQLSVTTALLTAFALHSFSLSLSFLISPQLFLVLAIYIGANLLYSKLLKQAVIIDAMCFALFFILRVITGGITAQVTLSHWIIICTALLALLIAFGKRHQEILLLEENARNHRPVLERYNLPFIEQMMGITTASLVVAYTLYTVDTHTVSFFGSKNLILTVPFVYYGTFRYLYNIYHLEKGGDPTEIFLTDRKLQGSIILWLLVTTGILYFK